MIRSGKNDGSPTPEKSIKTMSLQCTKWANKRCNDFPEKSSVRGTEKWLAKLIIDIILKGTGTRDLIWLKVASLDRSWLVGLTDDL